MFKKFDLPEIGEVIIYKRRASRSIRLSITSRGEVRVSIPSWTPYAAGVQFASSRTVWILLHKSKSHDEPLYEGQRIGRLHRLHFAIKFQADEPSTRTQNGVITVTHPAIISNDAESVQKAAERASIKALRSEAEAYIPNRVTELAALHGFSYSSVSIKQLKRRWGSCDQSHNLVFNLFLMQLPDKLIDYVIMHEFTHTIHMDHSAGFWETFEQHFPNAKEHRKLMRNYETKVATYQ